MKDGDGRADYVYIGKGGSLGLYLNTGTQGGHDVLFLNQGGIATGASSNIDNIVLSDINGDGMSPPYRSPPPNSADSVQDGRTISFGMTSPGLVGT